MAKTILKICLIIFDILFIGVLISSLIVQHETIIDFVMLLSGYPTHKHDVMEGLLSPNRVLMLQACVTIGIVAISVYIYKYEKIYSCEQKFAFYLARAIKGIFADLKTKNALIVLAIPFLSCIFFAFTIPVSLDEAFTYVEFTNKPFYYCAIFYPYPNNHVLHSLLTNLTDLLPILPTLFKLRIPAMLASIGAWIVGYSFVKRFYSEKLAMIVIGVTSMSFMALYYGFMARGYSMVLLFFVVALYASFNIIKNGNQTKDWLFFMISSALGFYTMPSFLYPYVTLNVLILIYNYKIIKKQIIYNVLTVVTVALLYLPIIVVDGVNALVNNNFVIPKSRALALESLPSFYNDTLFELFKIPSIAILILIAASITIAIRNKDKFTLALWIIFGIAPFVLLLAHSVIPFSRTFNYYGLVLIFLIAISLRNYLNRIPNLILLTSILIIQVISLIYFYTHIGEHEGFNTKAKIVNDWVFNDRSEKNTYYIAGSYNVQNFIYELVTNGHKEKDMTINWTDKPISTDTITGYNYVIVDSHLDATKERKRALTSGEQNVYKKMR